MNRYDLIFAFFMASHVFVVLYSIGNIGKTPPKRTAGGAAMAFVVGLILAWFDWTMWKGTR